MWGCGAIVQDGSLLTPNLFFVFQRFCGSYGGSGGDDSPLAEVVVFQVDVTVNTLGHTDTPGWWWC